MDPRYEQEQTRPVLRFVAPGEERRRVLVDVFGPSNSGKTYSALTLAAGLIDEFGGKAAMIDTEGRGNLYEDEFAFDRYVMEPPFTPAAFMAAYEQLDSQYSVIITDTISDEYEGIGGLQEMAEAQQVNNDVAKWARPKAAHRKLMARIRQLRAQHIFCVRAEDKIEIIEGEENGRKKRLVRPLGWVRVAEKKWKYDMTVSLFFPPGSGGKAEVDKMIGPLQGSFRSGHLVTRDYGRALGQWAKGAPAARPIVTADTAAAADIEPPADKKQMGREFYKQAKEALAAGDYPTAVQCKLKALPYLDNKGIAAFDALLNEPPAEDAETA